MNGKAVIEIHVFSDASVGKLGFSGAYIVGIAGSPVGIYVAADNSTEAELLTSEAAVRDARSQHPTANIVVHTDLANIDRILVTLRARGAMKLRAALRDCAASIVPDGNNHKQHRLCHSHARVMAGIKGTGHPNLVKERKRLRLRPTTRQKYIAVIEALQNNPMGSSEVRLAQESGVGLNDVHKILRSLQGHCKVRCERPDGVDGCDLAKWKWHVTVQFGTLLGEVMELAGIKSA